jgi:hypothetical protein
VVYISKLNKRHEVRLIGVIVQKISIEIYDAIIIINGVVTQLLVAKNRYVGITFLLFFNCEFFKLSILFLVKESRFFKKDFFCVHDQKSFFWGLSNPLSFTISHTH